MKPLREFREFLEQGIAKKRTPDLNRASSLIDDAEKRRAFLQQMETSMGITDDDANYYVEAAYDVLIQLVRAKLLQDGYTASGESAHEAEVAYMRELQFSEKDVRFMNTLRFHRNGIKYYGKRFDMAYAHRVLIFLEQLYPKLKCMASI